MRGGAGDPLAREEAERSFRSALEIAERQGAFGLVARVQDSMEPLDGPRAASERPAG